MTTIQDLPPELLHHLLDLGANSYRHDPCLISRSRFLKAASLVCRNWYHEGRPLLHRSVYVSRESSCQLLLSLACFGEHPTWSLKVVGMPYSDGKIKAQTARRVIEQAHGLRKLDLVGMIKENCLDLKILMSPTLYGLKTLSISPSSLTVDYAKTSPATLPFSLEHLAISGSRVESLPPLAPPFSLFYSPTITSFQASLSSRQPEFIKFFSSLAPQLLKLQINFFDPLFLPNITACTSLSHLSADCRYPQLATILTILPIKLSRLSIGPNVFLTGLDEPTLALDKLLDFESMREVKRVGIEWDEEDFFILANEADVERIKSRVQSQGVRVDFDDGRWIGA